MKKRSLIFRRINQKKREVEDASKRAAVSKRHPLFGALKGLVRVAPGTDLTEPADPEWDKDL